LHGDEHISNDLLDRLFFVSLLGYGRATKEKQGNEEYFMHGCDSIYPKIKELSGISQF
jgi:hypothetical protein